MPRPAKTIALARLEKLMDQMPYLKTRNIEAPEFTKWRRDTRIALENIFEGQPERVKEFTGISYYLSAFSSGTPDSEFHRAYVRGLERANAILQSMVGEIEEYWEADERTVATELEDRLSSVTVTNEVFVVHGHDHGTKETVARFLENLEVSPIILHERPDQGRTIIEKFEEYAQVSYAVVLLTPDDVGGSSADQLAPRARQNVIFELGFFLGQLGRGRVAALVKGELEIPSDYSGVLYIPLDENDGWQMRLARELRSAGFLVDLNNLA